MAARPTPEQSKQFALSEKCQAALRGGVFDARHFLAKPRKIGTEEEHVALQTHWRNTIKIVDLLNQHPEQIDHLLTLVQDRVMGYRTRAAADKDASPAWPNTYTALHRIPKNWRGQYLVQNLAAHGFDAELLSLVDKVDPHAANHIFDFLHAVHPQRPLPRSCLDQGMCTLVFAKRMTAMDRVKHLLAALDMTTGVIDWTRAGCFALRKENGQLVLYHCSDTSVPGLATTILLL